MCDLGELQPHNQISLEQNALGGMVWDGAGTALSFGASLAVHDLPAGTSEPGLAGECCINLTGDLQSRLIP